MRGIGKKEKFHGNGTYRWKNGDIHVGAYQRNQKNGHGEYLYNSSQTRAWYEGEFLNDKMQGHGTLIFKDGSKYKGAFQNGDPNGSGVLTFARGKKKTSALKYEGKTKSNDGC